LAGAIPKVKKKPSAAILQDGLWFLAEYAKEQRSRSAHEEDMVK
jgi:hypothetical protein